MSDAELAQYDGYTSSSMEQRIDDEGNTHFERSDDEACHYYHSAEGEMRVECETDSLGEQDRIAKRNFSRVLQQFANTRASADLDLIVDNRQFITLEILLEDFDYYHRFAVDEPDQAVVLFGGINISDGEDGPMIIENEQRVRRAMADGEKEASVVIDSEFETDGVIEVGRISIGSNDDDALAAPSLGSLKLVLPEDMRQRIVIRQ
ncbi:MAG: hypothetical protein ACQES2_05185 [Pseudomonadota bacterium]